jgi:hypothetical protein
LVNVFGVLVSLEVSTAPLGTATGGFTFTFDSQSGTFKRSTETFGPMFGQRSSTTGRGMASLGFNTLHASYGSVAGLDLHNGDFRLVKGARTTAGVPLPFSYSNEDVTLSSDTGVMFLSYGLTDNLDIGLAVPWVNVSVAVDVGLFSATNEDLTPGGHLLVLPATSVSGVGDIEILGKYRVRHQGKDGLAVALDVRLPSGDTNNLQGIGVTRTQFSGIWSRDGRISPHASGGYELWSDKVRLQGDAFVKDQINYAVGVELEAHPKATVVLDVVGRRLLHGGDTGYEPLTLVPGVVADVLVDRNRGLDVVSFAPGVKWNVAGNVLLNGSVLLSIANRGVRAAIIPVVGLEWSF